LPYFLLGFDQKRIHFQTAVSHSHTRLQAATGETAQNVQKHLVKLWAMNGILQNRAEKNGTCKNQTENAPMGKMGLKIAKKLKKSPTLILRRPNKGFNELELNQMGTCLDQKCTASVYWCLI
jgi:hypothetical protein